MKYKRFFMNLAMLAAFPLIAGAADPVSKAEIEQTLRDIFPDFEITSFKETQIKGIYEVMQGAEIYYVSGDGRYFLHGDIYDLKERRNLTEAQKTLARTGMLEKLSVNEYIEFAPAHAEHLVYVFTDIDCSYCRRLHSQIKDINNLGIAVRYLAFPRSGEETETFAEMESVWCAKNRQQALTSAKLGKKPVMMSCSNPVAHQYSLGRSMGVRGTPAIFTTNGKYIGGYLAPEELIEEIQDAY